MHWSEVPNKALVTTSIENSKGFMNAVQGKDTDKLNPIALGREYTLKPKPQSYTWYQS